MITAGVEEYFNRVSVQHVNMPPIIEVNKAIEKGKVDRLDLSKHLCNSSSRFLG
jgi:hypothetical protein